MKKIYLLCLVLIWIPALSVAHANTDGLIIVWSQTDALYIWRNGETHDIELSGMFKPILSPNAERLVLIPINDDGMPTSFMTMRLDGSDRYPIDIPYPNQILWQSDTVFWVNNYRRLPEGSMTPFDLNNRLYRVDAQTGTIDEWELDDAFIMTISSDGAHLIIVRAGEYPQGEGVIGHISLMNDDIQPVELFRFPSVSFASHIGYYPVVQFIADGTLRVAIPAPDAVYAVGADMPPTQLWRLTYDGQHTLLGEVQAQFYAGVVWSMDGERMSYIMPTTKGDMLIIASPTGEIFHNQQLASPFGFIIPAPMSATFLYWDVRQNGRLMTYADNMPLQEWLSAEACRMTLTSISSYGVTVICNSDSDVLIGYALFGDKTIYEIVKFSEFPLIDVKWLEK